MILDFSNNIPDINWDCVVIGAGAVGIYSAIKLGRLGKKVLVLESGDAQHSSVGVELNKVVMSGRPHGGATDGRARVVGGTTTLWGGQLTKFSESDFRQRGHGGPEWQIKYDEIREYYISVAKELGLDLHLLDDDSVFDKNDLEFTSEHGEKLEIFFTRWLKEQNFALNFSEEISCSQNVYFLKRAHARRIVDRVDLYSLVFVSGWNSMEKIFKSSQIILACGTIEISRLLLLSASDVNNSAWANNKLIGKYFQDHLDLEIGCFDGSIEEELLGVFENRVLRGNKYQPKIKISEKNLTHRDALNTAVSFKFNSSLNEDLAALKLFIKAIRRGVFYDMRSIRLKQFFSFFRVWFPLMWRYVRHRRIGAFADNGISLVAHCEQKPLVDSKIYLDEIIKDRFGDPVANINWRVDEDSQIYSLRKIALELLDIFNKKTDAKLVINQYLLNGDSKFLEMARDSYHQCGGACMGASENSGVVDRNCRVFNSQSIYVAGAAVFPYSSFANPTFTALALADRLVKFISGN